MRLHRNEVLVTVFSPKNLNPADLAKLRTLIQKRFLEPGQIPIMSHEVQPNLISGMKLLIDDREIDWSTETRLKRLAEAMEGAINRYFDAREDEIETAYRKQGGILPLPVSLDL